MGLDMYLNGRLFFYTDREKVEGFEVASKELELGYWRKHPDLHGYIVNTFAKGEDKCQKIELDVDDLFNIIEAIKLKKLPKTSGFFFGESDGTEDDFTIDVLVKAAEWLQIKTDHDGRSVYYQASW